MDLLALANRFGFGSAAAVIDPVLTSMVLWPTFAAAAGVPKDLATR